MESIDRESHTARSQFVIMATNDAGGAGDRDRTGMTSLEGWRESTATDYVVHKWQVTVGTWSVANTHERQRPRDIRGIGSIRRCVRRRRRLVVGVESWLGTERLFGWQPSAAADVGLMGCQLGCQNRPCM